MLIEYGLEFSNNGITKNSNVYTIIGNGNSRKIVTLSNDELFLTKKDLKQLGSLYSVKLFMLSELSDSTFGSIFRTPLFCKKERDYEKEILLQKNPIQIAECIDDMKTLYDMFPDCKKTAMAIQGNIKILNEIFKTVFR